MGKDELNNDLDSGSLGSDQEGEYSIFKEFFIFLMENKIWWITPTVLILLLVIGFIIITMVSGGGPVAPFIYTLF